MDFSGIEKIIVSIKGQNVLIDSDVASIYGVLTKEVNQDVKNNPEKFPHGYIVDACHNIEKPSSNSVVYTYILRGKYSGSLDLKSKSVI